jgi:N-hydroxyarylamine O-acetyltransferase
MLTRVVGGSTYVEQLIERSPVLAFAKDERGRYLYVNAAWLALCGLERDAVLGRTDSELFAPETANVFVGNDRRILETRQSISVEETFTLPDVGRAGFVSGYAEETLLERGVRSADINLLRKPFTPNTSLKRVNAIHAKTRHRLSSHLWFHSPPGLDENLDNATSKWLRARVRFDANVEAYLRRIEYEGSSEVSLDTLNRIIEAHVRQIPFENLDVLLGVGISTDLEAIEAKLVGRRRGGYCFEQNTLLLHVLHTLGFIVTPISARVRLQRSRDTTPPRTHLFLRVDVEGGVFLADVGIGALSPTCALALELDVVQSTPHEDRRILSVVSEAHTWARAPAPALFHQACLDGVWEDVCEFTLEPMPEIDVQVANWYTSAHPQSHFRQRLVVARATRQGRLTLVNRELKRRGADGRATVEHLTHPEQLLEVLAEEFGLRVESGTRFECPALDWHNP